MFFLSYLGNTVVLKKSTRHKARKYVCAKAHLRNPDTMRFQMRLQGRFQRRQSRDNREVIRSATGRPSRTQFDKITTRHEQRHFYANKAKTEVRHFCLKHLSGPVLRDTARLPQRYPPIARYGVFGVSTWQIGCDIPSPFSERFPLGEHAKWRCDTPPLKRGISAILARYPYENKANGCDTPLCDTISKGYCAIWGGYLALGRLSETPHARKTR